MTLTAADIKRAAAELGFVACGITVPGPSARADAFDRWLARGYAGTMRYLHRQGKKRRDSRNVDTAALRVIVLLDSYYTPEGPHDADAPRVARFARGADYHRVIGARLERLCELLAEGGARVARPYADAGPVPERELAERAGLGWIGKNTMLLNRRLGSFCFIASVFTDLPLDTDAPDATDHCGSCTRCLDACPTGAFPEPRVLDATRCISYLTIEYKAAELPEPLAERLEGWAFGCDICNDVCPWNVRFARETAIEAYRPRGHLDGIGSPDELDGVSEEEWAGRVAGTALERTTLPMMRRNLRAALRPARAGER